MTLASLGLTLGMAAVIAMTGGYVMGRLDAAIKADQ